MGCAVGCAGVVRVFLVNRRGRSPDFIGSGASHASHSTKEIMKNVRKSIIFNDSGPPALPTLPKKS